MLAGSKKSAVTAAHSPGRKRALVVEVQDVERGEEDGKAFEASNPSGGTWMQKLKGNNWG